MSTTLPAATAATATTDAIEHHGATLHWAARHANCMAYVWPFAQKVLREQPLSGTSSVFHALRALAAAGYADNELLNVWRTAVCTNPDGLFTWICAQQSAVQTAGWVLLDELAARIKLPGDIVGMMADALAELRVRADYKHKPLRVAAALRNRLITHTTSMMATWFAPALGQINLVARNFAERPPPRLRRDTATGVVVAADQK